MLKLFRLHKNEFLSEHHQDVKDCIKYENSMVNLYSDNSKDLIKLIHNIYKFNDDIKICLTNGSEDALWKLFCHYKSNYKQLCVPRFTWHYYTTLGKRFNYSIKEITKPSSYINNLLSIEGIFVLSNNINSVN